MNDVKMQCVACQLEIPVNATKCVHCGSSQNWKRHIEFGNTSIALLIGLLAILTTVPSTIRNLAVLITELRTPSIFATIQEIHEDRIDIALSNNTLKAQIVQVSGCFGMLVLNGTEEIRNRLRQRAADQDGYTVNRSNLQYSNSVIIAVDNSPIILAPNELLVYSAPINFEGSSVLAGSSDDPIDYLVCPIAYSHSGDLTNAKVLLKQVTFDNYTGLDVPGLLERITVVGDDE